MIPPKGATLVSKKREGKAGAEFQPKIGRPSEASSVAINEVILEKAAGLFLSQGYEATSMGAVASLAGVFKACHAI